MLAEQIDIKTELKKYARFNIVCSITFKNGFIRKGIITQTKNENEFRICSSTRMNHFKIEDVLFFEPKRKIGKRTKF